MVVVMKDDTKIQIPTPKVKGGIADIDDDFSYYISVDDNEGFFTIEINDEEVFLCHLEDIKYFVKAQA